jgi:hypothetical protein
MLVGNSNIYTGLFFRKVAYTSNDVAWFLEWMDFTHHPLINSLVLFKIFIFHEQL